MTGSTSRVGVGLLFLVPVLLAGCVQRGRESPFHSSVREETMTLRVENHNVHDAEIYLRPSGRRQRLGAIASRAVEFFEFPWNTGIPLDIEIQLSVGERHRLPPLPVTRGGRVELTIAPELRQSFIRY